MGLRFGVETPDALSVLKAERIALSLALSHQRGREYSRHREHLPS